MLPILILTTTALLVFILLTGRYLLPDLSRLWMQYGLEQLSGRHNSSYYGELFVSLYIVIIIATGSAVTKGAAATLVAWLTTSDIQSFTTALRGTFSFSTQIQHPQNHIVLFFVAPLLKLLATFVMLKVTASFMDNINRAFKNYYAEDDLFFFSSVGILWIITIEVFWHIQSINALNLTANMAYVVLDKLSYLIFFLSLFWVKQMRNDRKEVLKAFDKYLEINSSTEKKLTESPAAMLAVSYVMALILSLPYFLGMQWLKKDVLLIVVFLVIAALCYVLLKYLFSDAWNYMSTVVFDSTHQKPLTNDHLFKRVKPAFLLGAFGILTILFSVFHFKSMFMFFAIGFTVLLLILSMLYVAFAIPFLVSRLMTLKRDSHQDNWTESAVYYHKLLTPTLLKSLVGLTLLPLIAFMTITLFPKTLAANSTNTTSSFMDPNGEVLYMSNQEGMFCVPVEYDELPEFFTKALVNQEDRSFFKQRNLLPNTSNWHGVSFAFLKNRGASNINGQLVKNITFLESSCYPKDISRKMSDLIGGYMLSLTKSPEDILTEYVNVVCFHGGRGHRGVNAAALYAFGRPLNKLNKLEQSYLVNTLPRSTYLCDKEAGQISYTSVHRDNGIAKKILLNKAERWLKNGLITQAEFRELSSDTLAFTNYPYRSPLCLGTKLRLMNNVKGKEGRYQTYITLENEEHIQQAYQTLTSTYSNVFRKNGAELQAATLLVDVQTGHVIGHFSTGMTDYAKFNEGFPIGSLGKPAIILEMLRAGASPQMTLFDGQVGSRKTPRNANHEWSNRPMTITEMLSLSVNAPFVNICDIMNPRTVFQNVENSYRRMGIASEERDRQLCNDTYNYPLGPRFMFVDEVAQLYQTILNDGICLPLSTFVPSEDTAHSVEVYDRRHTRIVKDALLETVESGTMSGFRSMLPAGTRFYSKTGTSSRQRDGWCMLSDGRVLIVTWVSYGRPEGDRMVLGAEPLYGGGTAGLFSVLIYNQLHRSARRHN